MYKLRDYQQSAHDITISYCKETNKPAFHYHSVGAGKTLSIAFAMKHVVDKGGRSICLSRQGELALQNSSDYRDIGGKCSIMSASLNRKSVYYPAVFATEGTACRALQYEFKGLKFDFMAIDECHEVPWQDVLDCISDHQNGFDIYENKNKEGKTKYPQYAVIICHFLSVNPKMRIIGYTGSPFRGSEDILGDFWKEKLSEVTTYELVNKGYLVPPVFGWGSDDEHRYHLEEFKPSGNPNSGDFGQKELLAMQRKILKDKSLTQQIIEEVVARTSDRLGVLITCAGKKHCEEVSNYLPDGTWAIVTDEISAKKRIEILEKARNGEIKYVIQVNCLGQGVNITRWDTLVILRKIGSLRYLIQLIGRVLRTLKPEQIEDGLHKDCGMVLDFTDTLESAGNIYDDPILDKALAQKATEHRMEVICPKCETANSQYAVRCIGADQSEDDGRCGHYFSFNECGMCGAHNAPSAKTCRKCDAIMIDPNKALLHKAYTDADYKPVLAMHFGSTQNGKLKITYQLDSTYHQNGIEKPEVAIEYYAVDSKQPHEKARWYGFIKQHIQGEKFRQGMLRHRQVELVIRNKAMFDKPTEITHRKNDKGFSIINRKRFRSGREEKAS